MFACSESDIITSNHAERIADRYAREHLLPKAFLDEWLARVYDLEADPSRRVVDRAAILDLSDQRGIDPEICERWIRESGNLEEHRGTSNEAMWTERIPEAEPDVEPIRQLRDVDRNDGRAYGERPHRQSNNKSGARQGNRPPGRRC